MRSLHQTIDPARRAELCSGPPSDPVRIAELLDKAEGPDVLESSEIADLLRVGKPDLLETMRAAALRVKERHFGKVIRLFAPLYFSNDCVNNCLYCGFRRDNVSAVRKTLDLGEVITETRILESRGFNDIILVASEHPSLASPAALAAAVDAVRKETGIRRITLNSAPMAREDFEMLRGAGVDVYQSFQETYDPDAYRDGHPSGKKRDYDWRLTAMDRAARAGFRKVGMGVLYGLADPAAETLALIAHARYLIEEFGIASPGLSLPRLRPAMGAVMERPPRPVSDAEFMKILAVCRLALPNSDISISTREHAEFRDELVLAGATRLSAGSETRPGGYGLSEEAGTGQFEIFDTRSVDAVVASLCVRGLLPALDAAEASEGAETVTCSAFSSMIRFLLHHASPETRRIGQERAIDLLREIFGQAPSPRFDAALMRGDG